MSSGLSGTYQTALQASDMVDTKVTVLIPNLFHSDSATNQRLVELINTNLSSNQIVNKLKELQKNIKLFVVIGQLNQLIKGGRIVRLKVLLVI